MGRVSKDPSTLESSVQCQLETVNTHCKEVKGLKQLITDRELQLNDWAVDTLQQELCSLGFSGFVKFPHNAFSLYGNSRPDFAFFKQLGNKVLGGVLMEQETVDTIYGSTLEFKVEFTSMKLSQAFANMVRVAHDMLCDALKRGKVVNSVKVYGLVVFHKVERCLPMMYCCDFTNNCYQIEVGQETDFYNGLHLLYSVKLY